VKIEISEAVQIDPRGEVSFAQLIECSGLPETELRELVAYGALAPVDPEAAAWIFGASAVRVARLAGRLQHDLELDANAVSLLLRCIERIDALEDELRAMRAGVAGPRARRE
jgi:hypothetical protein